MIQACVFDLDGTLINSIDDLADAVNYTLRLYRYPEHEPAEYRYMVGNGAALLIERALPEGHRTEREIAKALDIYRERYAAHSLDKTRPYEGMTATLRRLRAAGLRLAVISNKPDSDTQAIIEKLFPARLFDVVCGHRDGMPHKPDPQGVLEACARMGIKPSGGAMLGDSAVDIKTALAAGMTPLGALWGFRERDELAEAGAKFLLEKPAELPEVLSRI